MVANVLLAGAALWLAERKPAADPPQRVASNAVQVTEPEIHSARLISEHPVRTEPKHFQWDQVESDDYRVYIANLRGIGCPEETVRDIITADVDKLYATRRQQWERAHPNDTLDTINEGLGQLKAEEDSVLQTLLGSSASQAASAAPTPARVRRGPPADDTVRMPLILQPVDSSSMRLTDAQAQELDALRANFIQEVGGTNQDPNDPAYRQRWVRAQHNADLLMAGELGMSFVTKYRENLAEQSTP